MYFKDFLPEFIEGIHYRKLSHGEGHKKYKYVTLKTVELHFKKPFTISNETIFFLDGWNRAWIKMTGNTLLISKGYAWDGCTPKKWWGIWWGTPDFEKTILASLVHDSFRQFATTAHFPFFKDQVDKIFYEILRKKHFWLGRIYYWGVKLGNIILPEKNHKTYSLTV